MATTSLLADQEQVAQLRELIHYARRVGALHAIYSIGDGTGRAYGPREHTWDLGVARVAYDDGCLVYRQHGERLLTARNVTTVRQAAGLLAAIGVLPQQFIGATAGPVNRCRHCGATSGLRLAPGSSLADREFQCWDGCRDSAR